MRTAEMNRRLLKLSERIRPGDVRHFTLEELCRLYWRINKPGFLALTKETPGFNVFLSIFQREEAEAEQGRNRA
jgi:hypothetical protein